MFQPNTVHIYPKINTDQGIWWPLNIPRRIWFGLIILTSPIKALAFIMEMAVMGCVLTVVGVGWAWWTHHITDEQVASVLSITGERLLSILTKSGILQ